MTNTEPATAKKHRSKKKTLAAAMGVAKTVKKLKNVTGHSSPSRSVSGQKTVLSSKRSPAEKPAKAATVTQVPSRTVTEIESPNKVSLPASAAKKTDTAAESGAGTAALQIKPDFIVSPAADDAENITEANQTAGTESKATTIQAGSTADSASNTDSAIESTPRIDGSLLAPSYSERGRDRDRDSENENDSDEYYSLVPENDDDDDDNTQLLDSTEQHYLKKQLLSMEIMREISKLSPTSRDNTGLRRFGPPFHGYDPGSMTPGEALTVLKDKAQEYRGKNKTEVVGALKAKAQELKTTIGTMAAEQAAMGDENDTAKFDREYPLLRFFLTNFVETFPLIKMRLEKHGFNSDDPNEFWDKVQMLFETWKSKNISNSNDRGEISRRNLVLYKMKSLLLMLYNSAIRCTGDDAYFDAEFSTHRNTYKKLSKIVGAVRKYEQKGRTTLSQQAQREAQYLLEEIQRDDDNFIQGLDVNVISCAKTHARSRVGRGTSHYDFLIRIKDEKTGKTWYIKRRYTDFVRLEKKLKELYVGRKFASLPSKIKSRLSVALDEDYGESSTEASSIAQSSIVSTTPDSDDDEPDIKEIESRFLQSLALGRKKSKITSRPESTINFARENMRVALRGYLRSLCDVDEIRESAELKEFLEARSVKPTNADLEDARARQQLDHLVELQHLKFQQETVKAIENIENSIADLKQAVMNKGVRYVLDEIKTHKKLEELSVPLKALCQLVELEIASTQFQMFMGTDSAKDTFRSAKKIHRWFPYTITAYIMRFTNPFNVVKHLVDLFTYQPPHVFSSGRRHSLIQKLFTGILDDDVQKFTRELAHTRKLFLEKAESVKKAKGIAKGSIDDFDYGELLDKIDNYFHKGDDEVTAIKKDAEYFNMDLVMSILLKEGGLKDGKTPKKVLAELLDEYMAKNEKKPLFGLAKQYFLLQLKKFDRLMMAELWEEPEMINLAKELMSVFFEPMISLFKKAEIHKYIPIIQEYVTELIKLVEYYQKDYNKLSQTDVVASFMDLQNKYAPYAYEFLHNLYLNDLNAEHGDHVFDSLANWIDGFVNLINYSKENKSKITMDMNALLDAVVDKNYDRQKVVDRVQKIVAEVQQKREFYANIGKDKDSTIGKIAEAGKKAKAAGETARTRIESQARSVKVNQNWDKINDRITEVAAKLTTGDGPGGVAGAFGIDEEDIHEMNDNLSPEELQKIGGKKVRYIENAKTGREFLEQYVKMIQEGKLESDPEYQMLQQWEDMQFQEDLGKLSGPFRNYIYTTLQDYKQYARKYAAERANE